MHSLMINKRFFSNIIFIILFSIPIFRYYDIPGTSIGSESFLILLLLLCTLGLYLFPNKTSYLCPELKRSKKYFGLFIMWSILITMFYELFTKYNYNNPNSTYTLFSLIVALMAGVTILLLLDSRLDIHNAMKIYSVFVWVIIAVYVLQWVFQLSGITVSFKMPFHEYCSSWKGLQTIVFGMQDMPTSLFSERSHLCIYLLPYLSICLYSEKLVTKNRIRKAIIVSVVIVSTVSGNGIITAAIAWILYFLFYGSMSKKTRIPISVLGIATIVVLYFALQNTEVFGSMFNKLFINSNTDAMTGTKASYRIYRGFDYYSQLPFVQKMFGVGFVHMKGFALDFGLSSIYDSSFKSFEWFSTITEVLLYFGIAGFAMFFLNLWSLFRSKSKFVKCWIIIFFSLCFSSQFLFLETHLFFMAFAVIAYLSEQKTSQQTVKIFEHKREWSD